MCNKNGALTDCGKGRFCGNRYSVGSTCVDVVDTGFDGEDKYLAIGGTALGSTGNANDVDVFVFDTVVAGSYHVNVTPVGAPLFDVAVDIYNGAGELQFTMDIVAGGSAEDYSFNAPVPGRGFLAVRTANAVGGDYRITLTKE
jgi:hypothetical protein